MTSTIKSLPTRFEPLINQLGVDAVSKTLMPVEGDLKVMMRLLSRQKGANQGKVVFIRGGSGSGKTTFVHSLEFFLRDHVSKVVRAPLGTEMNASDLPSWLAGLSSADRITVVNLDGRETPQFDEREYRGLLGQMNEVLRARKDLVLCWPVEDRQFADAVVALLHRIAGKSAFGRHPVHELAGVPAAKFTQVLERLLQIANWTLADAAIEQEEIEELAEAAASVGGFLDDVQELVYDRFELDHIDFEPPKILFALSSGKPAVRSVCRALRRADTYYLEAARLMMFAKRRKIGRWWAARAGDPRTALPHVIAQFNAQLVSVSPSATVHAVFNYGDDECRALNEGSVSTNKGAAKATMRSGELTRFFAGRPVDIRAAKGSLKQATIDAYGRIQAVSATKHRALNEAVAAALIDVGAPVESVAFERAIVQNLQTDWVVNHDGDQYAVEFHHKAAAQTTEVNVADYVLTKLSEYAIECGFAQR